MKNFARVLTVCFFLTLFSLISEADTSSAVDDYNQGAAVIRDSKGGKIDEAMKYFQSAVEADPDFKTAYQAMADAYLLKYEINPDQKKEWLYDSLKVLDTLLQKYPGDGKAYLTRATACAYLGDYEKADLEFKKALLALPKDSDAYITYFSYVLEQKGINEAENFAEKTRTKQITDPLVFTFYSEQFLAGGEPVSALANVQYALTLDGNCLEALILLGDIHKEQEKYVEAVEAYEKAAQQPDVPATLYFKLGYVHAGLGQYKEAMDMTRKYLDKYPQDLSAIYNMAMYAEKAPSREEAMVLWKSILDNPDAPEKYRQKAEEHLTQPE